MVDAFISVVMEKLVGLGEDELKLLCGTHEEVNKLSGTLKMIRPYLQDAEARQFNESEVGSWLKRLKYVTYEADDVLDEWQTKSQQRSIGANLVWNFFARCTCFHQLALSHSVGKKIQKINGKLDDIDNLSKKFNFLKSSYVTTVMGEGINFPSVIRNARKTTSSVEEIFGREDEINGIKDKLINSSETSKLAVVSIFGPPGCGKTTLAKYVFNDGEVKQHFQQQIWVCVSDEFGVASIMRKMIEAAMKESPSVGELEALQRKITDEVLKDKLFLLVLDDVWNEDYGKWEKLFNAIKNCGLKGSQLLVTTRSENVCKVMGSAHMFQVGNISSFEHCRSIFESVAFENRNESERRELRTVGEKIVKKCKGVPLAIKTVAGALRTKITKEDWEIVLKSDMWDWEPKLEMGILPALLLSYYNLSPPLKQCFQYCAIYPKDYVISKEEIVQQWIAHGYISEKKNMEMEDIGEKYFDELVARSLLQEARLDYYDINKIGHCKMHDLVHDLALFVTNGEFLHINKEENIELDIEYPPLHCSISNIETPNIKIDVEKLRTFIPSESYKREGGFQIKEMQHLRVLDLNSWSLEVLPDVVGKLIHLRYLKLRGEHFKALPRSLGKLQNLLCLDLYGTSIDALPESVGKLRKLRHLTLNGNRKLKLLPSTIGMLTNLRKLNLGFTPLDEIPDCVGKLDLLRYLNLEGTEIRGLPESVRDLSRLQVLDVSHCQKLENLPAGIFDKMTGLKQLGSWNTCLRGLPAGIGKLSRLQRLDQFRVLGNREEEEAGPSSSMSSSSSNIGELRDLNHLHGYLCISNLDLVTSEEEAASAQLCNKNSLTWLRLEWNADIQGTMETTTSEDVLQALRPWSALHQLWIERYPGRTVPTWLGDSSTLMLSGLQVLSLRSWDGCANLPALGNLPELRRLEIRGMPKVRRVGAEWFGSNRFPKLKHLAFDDMAEWEEWDNSLQETKLFFPCLIQLNIRRCPKLRSLPPIFSTSPLREIDVHACPNLLNSLGILPASIVTLGYISAEWVNGLPSLPNLAHLKIRGDDGVQELSNHLVEYRALKILLICNCPNLESLPQEMASLKQLQKLEIWNCPKLEESCNKEGAQWCKIQHIPYISINSRDVRRNA